MIYFSEGIERLYLVSYLWYPAIGAATTVVIALIVSSIKGNFHFFVDKHILIIINMSTYTTVYVPIYRYSISTILGFPYFCAHIGCYDPQDVDPKTIMPIFDRLFCCLPEKTLGILRCKIKLRSPQDIDVSL